MKREILTDQELKTLCLVYRELNAIRARDGGPQGVCHKFWDELTSNVNDIVEKQTGKRAWLHPLLYDEKLITRN